MKASRNAFWVLMAVCAFAAPAMTAVQPSPPQAAPQTPPSHSPPPSLDLPTSKPAKAVDADNDADLAVSSQPLSQTASPSARNKAFIIAGALLGVIVLLALLIVLTIARQSRPIRNLRSGKRDTTPSGPPSAWAEAGRRAQPIDDEDIKDIFDEDEDDPDNFNGRTL